MGLFGIGNRSKAGRSAIVIVDQSLPDRDWLAESSRLYEATVANHYGTPETMAAPGRDHYGHNNFGVAMFFFAKAVDMLQTAYCFGQMQNRQPSPGDVWIIDGYCNSLGAALSLHPDAPVGESARYTLGMIRSIGAECQRVGVPDALYAAACDRISFDARAHLP
jgi:hypothetical protein